MKKKNEKIGILGLGRMGRCLVQGMLETGQVQKEDLLFTTRKKENATLATKEVGIKACASNKELVKNCSVIILAVKPQNLDDLLKDVGQDFKANQTIISIVASVTTKAIESRIPKNVAVIRAMPNTPAFVRCAMTAMCPGAAAGKAHQDIAEKIFSSVGRVVQTEERHMDAVTGLSGCGPAYIYLVLEAMTEGGIKVGLPREVALELSAQTVLGAAKMLQVTGRHPSSLRDEVTTPAGCTIDGLVELEEGKLRVTLMKAVVKATERAHALSSL